MFAINEMDEVAHVLNNQLTVVENETLSTPDQQLRGDEVVFVVEDDLAVRNVVRSSLEQYGYTVFTAVDGDMALAVCEMFNTRPDLLLTDVVMPHMTGDELVDQLKEAGLMPRVLMMSGYTAGIEGVERKVKAGEVAFIAKPFSHHELARKVRQVLAAA